VGSASWDKKNWQMRSSADPDEHVEDCKKDCKSLANRCGMQFHISSFEHLWNKSGGAGVKLIKLLFNIVFVIFSTNTMLNVTVLRNIFVNVLIFLVQYVVYQLCY